jgi:hypothetical protein
MARKKAAAKKAASSTSKARAKNADAGRAPAEKPTTRTTKASALKSTVAPEGGEMNKTRTPATVTATTVRRGKADRTIEIHPTHEAISQRAYEIWIANGCPEGCDQEHWMQAELELTRN